MICRWVFLPSLTTARMNVLHEGHYSCMGGRDAKKKKRPSNCLSSIRSQNLES